MRVGVEEIEEKKRERGVEGRGKKRKSGDSWREDGRRRSTCFNVVLLLIKPNMCK